MRRKATNISRAHFLALGALAPACAGFAKRQNRPGALGGPISTPKTLWIGYTLSIFFVLPFFLWRNPALGGSTRRLFGWALASFSLRGAVEMVLLHATRRWQCIHGIGHNFFTLGLALGLREDAAPTAAELRARRGFFPLYLVTLLAESLMAWRFSRVASPADGVYFAAPHEERFRAINRLTWQTLIALGAWLGAFLWVSRKDFLARDDT